MRIAKLMLVCVCLAGLTQLVWSQSSSVLKTHERGIPGFLDPKTGMFTARVQSQEPTADVTPERRHNNRLHRNVDVYHTHHSLKCDSLDSCDYMRSQSVRDRHRHQHPPVPAVGSCRYPAPLLPAPGR